MRKERGELGEDHEFMTNDGKVQFAEGDRIAFAKTDKKQGMISENGKVISDRKKQGITNGLVGTIERIEDQLITVKLDGGKDRRLTFNAEQYDSFRHGYAGTIYKGQGRTLDDVYLYHSAHWKDASTYVALTRHRDNVKLFVSTQVTRDDADLARQMGRHDDRRASVAYATKEEAAEQRGERLIRAAFEVTGHHAAPIARLTVIPHPSLTWQDFFSFCSKLNICSAIVYFLVCILKHDQLADRNDNYENIGGKLNRQKETSTSAVDTA